MEADFLQDRDAHLRRFDHVVFTGPIDAFFGHCHGALEYRSLRFERVFEDVPDFQGNAVINYTDPDVPHTRVYEHKHFDMRYTRDRTLVTWEYPAAWQPGLPEIYPVNTASNQAVYQTYRVEASDLSEKVTFGGRLGWYRYFDMHQVVGAALATSRRLLERWR